MRGGPNRKVDWDFFAITSHYCGIKNVQTNPKSLFQIISTKSIIRQANSTDTEQFHNSNLFELQQFPKFALSSNFPRQFCSPQYKVTINLLEESHHIGKWFLERGKLGRDQKTNYPLPPLSSHSRHIQWEGDYYAEG